MNPDAPSHLVLAPGVSFFDLEFLGIPQAQATALVNDPAQADLVLVIEEQTLGPSFRTDGKPRLKDTLAVFPAGGPGTAPLWVGITTENALAAAAGLKTPNAEGVVQEFRRDVEDAKKRLKK